MHTSAMLGTNGQGLAARAARVDRHTGLLLGGLVAVAVLLAAAAAWPAESNVAARPGNERTDDTFWLTVYAGFEVLAFGIYLLALLVVRRRPATLAATLLVAAVIQLAPLAAPLMHSTDAWGYWSFARISTEHGGNPYADPQSTFADDTALPWTNPSWRDHTTPYGPAFTLPSQGIAVLVGDDAQAAAWAYKTLAALGMLILTALVARFAPLAVFAAAFVGWNPIFAIQFAGAGHNEVLMIALLVGALGLARIGRPVAAGMSWALAAFVKWTSLVVLPLQLLEDRARGRRSLLPGLVAAGLALAAVATLVYGPAWAGHPLSATGDAASRLSLSIWPRLPGPIPDAVALIVPIVLFGLAYLWLLRGAWRGRARTGMAMALFLLASPYLWTWYLVTPAALSALDDDGPAMLLTLGMIAYAGLLYLGDFGSVFHLLTGGLYG